MLKLTHSTLEEAKRADLLLHVVDSSHPDVFRQIDAVGTVLDEIECGDKPTILVLNKIDREDDATQGLLLRKRHPEAVEISALRKEGLDELSRRVLDCVEQGSEDVVVSLSVSDGRVISWLQHVSVVNSERFDDEAAVMSVSMTASDLARFRKQFPQATVAHVKNTESATDSL